MHSRPVDAKTLRQFIVVQCYDAIVLERLPNMYGTTERLLVLAFATIILNFITIGLLTKDAGVFAFGHVLAMYALPMGNALAGEPSSLQTIRAREMFQALLQTAKHAGLNISETELKQQCDDYLAHPVPQDTMVIKLP